ncbi:protein SON-like isoform X3 [Stegostoma tigrinum]|uniref:protein SON-like isoform X3 n=1 Tax=Stegostoma tigrinum TaxID=3053191 RepID=UPI00202B9736|nr:protein SON-like isoform X3 [Stegostoma tigrinum]
MSGKVTNRANGEIKPVVEAKVSEDVADITVAVQKEPIMENTLHILHGFQNEDPESKESLTVGSAKVEEIKTPTLDDKEDSSPPVRRKDKKHKHKHHHKHKSKKKKKKKRKKKEGRRDRSRSRSGSRLSPKPQTELRLQSQPHSEPPLNNECSSIKSENISVLTKLSRTESNKNTVDEVTNTSIVVTVGVGKECSVAEKPLVQNHCEKSLHVKENIVADINFDKEVARIENISGLLAPASAVEQNQESKSVYSSGSDNVQSKYTQTVEEKDKTDRVEARRTKRSRSRSHSKSAKHHKSQLHSHTHRSVKKSSSGKHHLSQSSCSRKQSSPVKHRSKSTSREQKKHTESSPKSKRKQSDSRSRTRNEQQSKSKSRSPSRSRRKSRSRSATRTKQKSKSLHCSRSCSRSKHRSRTHSGSPVRSRSRVTRPHSPRPRSRSGDRRCHLSGSRPYRSRLVRTRRSPDWRRRSRSPLRRKSPSRTPERLTDLDKAQLLEIAKANAAAMCAKAGMPLPANLKPVVPLVKNVIAKKIGCTSIQELTEKCKKIVESNDNELGNELHVTEEDESVINQPIKVNELKSISFSLNNATMNTAAKTQVALTKEFPVSSGTQHRKKEVLNVYGEWVPMEKESEETADDVFTDVCTQAVDISVTMTERATAQRRLVKNPYDEAAMSMILQTQEQIDVWAQSNSLPGQFTGSTGAQVLTYEKLTNSGPQAWIRKFMFSGVSSSQTREAVIQRESNWSLNLNCRYKSRTEPWATLAGVFIILCMVASFFCEVPGKKHGRKQSEDQFLKAAPLSGGMGAHLMQKMGWRQGEGLGKNKNGPVEPIVVDFKIDRKGLVAEGEKTHKKPANFATMKDLSGKHPVSALIEICNKRKWPPPDFLMVHDSGPDHCKHFLFKIQGDHRHFTSHGQRILSGWEMEEVIAMENVHKAWQVMINGTEYKPSLPSPNKKHAKASAATIALQALGLVTKDGGNSTSDDAT